MSFICFSRNFVSPLFSILLCPGGLTCVASISRFLFHLDSLSFQQEKQEGGEREGREDKIAVSLPLSLWGHPGRTETLD